MRIKLSGFFLFVAIGIVSICELPPHPFAMLYSQAFDNSIPRTSILSKRDRDGNLLEIASLLFRQFVSMSKGLLSNRLLTTPSAIFSLIAAFVFLLTLPADRVLVLVLVHSDLCYDRP